jgi:hypothetical protein
MPKLVSHRSLFAALLVLGLSSTAIAEAPSTGLGQAWPNTADVSLSPHYHAYVFDLDGIRYIQINDINGNVLGGIGTSAGEFIALPMGRFARLVSTPQRVANSPNNGRSMPAGSPITVYNDDTTVLTATPMSDGSTMLTAAANAPCNDPASCGSHSP